MKHQLQFDCEGCDEPVRFSIFEIEKKEFLFPCEHCGKKYVFKDEVLLRQIKKFESLCRQILEAEEILGMASIGIDIGEHHVKIPYKILLSRLNSTLDLKVGNRPLSIRFRIEPPKDLLSLPL